MTESRFTVIPVIILSLLFGAWLFAVHTHHDNQVVDNDDICQICLFGAHYKVSLPVAGFVPMGITTDELPAIFQFKTFIAPHTRLQNPRAPPIS
jgi:hypothetical protein